jgi:hypothetical protein
MPSAKPDAARDGMEVFALSGTKARCFYLDLEANMSSEVKCETISRRRVLSLLTLPVALLGLTAATVLTSSHAEAETAGMENRQQRRSDRQQNRQNRRTGQ